MTRFYGLPILFGFIASTIFPDPSVELSPTALPLLVLLTFITSTRYSLKPFAQIKNYSFSILISILLSYLLSLCALDFLCTLMNIKDSIRLSILLTVATPFALIAPLFCRKHGSDANLSLLLVFISTLLSPLICYFTLRGFDSSGTFALVPMTKILILLASVMLLALIISIFIRFFSTNAWIAIQTKSSSLIIALLVYIFWGQTWSTFSNRILTTNEIIFILIVMFILDFGLYFLLNFLKYFVSKDQAHTLRITLSMKNLAIPSALILTYSPNMLFIPASGFLFHILLFNFLAQKNNL